MTDHLDETKALKAEIYRLREREAELEVELASLQAAFANVAEAFAATHDEAGRCKPS